MGHIACVGQRKDMSPLRAWMTPAGCSWLRGHVMENLPTPDMEIFNSTQYDLLD